MRTVLDLGHIPSGMEIFPAADVEQFEYIKKVIDECDYYVLIIGARYGSVDAAGVSFTEKEYDYAVEQKKTVLGFIHGDPGAVAVNKADTDPALAAKLNAFREKVSKGRLVRFWKTPEELTSKVTIALAKAFGDVPGVGWIRGNAVASEDLLAQLNGLRNQLDVLRAENDTLQQQTKPRIDGLADLNETFSIRYEYYRAGTFPRDKRQSSVGLTWAQIFAACGPSLFRPTAPARIGIMIKQYLLENGGIGKDRDHAELFASDVDRIKIQLIALCLIHLEIAEAKDGGVQDFVSLTPRGQQQLVELLAVRGQTPEGR